MKSNYFFLQHDNLNYYIVIITSIVQEGSRGNPEDCQSLLKRREGESRAEDCQNCLPQWRGETRAETVRREKMQSARTRSKREGRAVVVFTHLSLLFLYNNIYVL